MLDFGTKGTTNRMLSVSEILEYAVAFRELHLTRLIAILNCNYVTLSAFNIRKVLIKNVYYMLPTCSKESCPISGGRVLILLQLIFKLVNDFSSHKIFGNSFKPL